MNLRRKLKGERLMPFHPQVKFLGLIGTGNVIIFHNFSFYLLSLKTDKALQFCFHIFEKEKISIIFMLR
jgi:hypothetical protein